MTPSIYDLGNGIRKRAISLGRMRARSEALFSQSTHRALQALEFSGRQLMRGNDLVHLFSAHTTMTFALNMIYVDAAHGLSAFVSMHKVNRASLPSEEQLNAKMLKLWPRGSTYTGDLSTVTLWHLVGLHRTLKGLEQLHTQLGQHLYQGDYILNPFAMCQSRMFVHDICFMARQSKHLTPTPPWLQEAPT